MNAMFQVRRYKAEGIVVLVTDSGTSGHGDYK